MTWVRHTANGHSFWFETDGSSLDTLMIEGAPQAEWVQGLLNERDALQQKLQAAESENADMEKALRDHEAEHVAKIARLTQGMSEANQNKYDIGRATSCLLCATIFHIVAARAVRDLPVAQSGEPRE